MLEENEKLGNVAVNREHSVAPCAEGWWLLL